MVSLCIKDNNSHVQEFFTKELACSHLSDIHYSSHIFKNYQNTIVHYTGTNLNDFYNFLSGMITDAIVKFYEPQLVKNIISRNYFYFTQSDQEIIFDEFSSIITNTPDTTIMFNVNKYIKENKSIVLKGFVTFRLKNYIYQLDELIETAVNKFVIEKEYFEFVSLLKAYVDSKIPSPEIIDLVYANSEALLLDENGDLIDTEDFDCEYLSDITFSQNDYVLNTLIGKLPQEIRIHLISPKDEFIHTLELIFGNKIVVCSDCEICSAYKFLNL